MDKVEEILPRIASYLKEDLAKEPLSSKSEKKRLYYVSRIEQVLQDSAAQEIMTKYEPLPGALDVGEHRSVVLRGNVIPAPFKRTSLPAAATATAAAAAEPKPTEPKPTSKPNQVAATYEVIPCDQTYEEVCPKDMYEDAVLHGTSDGFKFPPVHPSTPPPPPPVHPSAPPPLPPVYPSAPPPPPPPEPIYEETCHYGTDRILEAFDSGSGTDYEEYTEAEEREDDTKKNRESAPVRHNSPTAKSKGRQQSSTADLTGKRYCGYLHQKGTFQFQRRFCALCGTRFLCCKSERSLKVVVEVNVREYEIVHQERREGKTSSYPHELRFSCPGKETYLFYTETRQSAEEWVKELRRATANKQDSVEASADAFDSSSLTDDADRQSENGETNISGGSIEKTKTQNPNLSDDGRKQSKLKSVLETIGKKLGNKTRTLLQTIDFGNPQAVEAEQEFGYVSIQSEEFTGDRWFRRFCRIENGQLNCYTDQWSTDFRPEFSLDLRGAELKPVSDELKIKLVKGCKEHSLKMSNFMHHGKWLMALIRETGYANQLASKASCNKDIYGQSALYEELSMVGVTEDDTTLDEEAPPLPTASPPSSPLPEPENLQGLQSLSGASKKKSDPEGIYMQPAEWIQDLELLKKKRKPLNVVPCSVLEESAYINRDFAWKALNSREKAPKKEKCAEKGSINTSSSYPNLTSLGITQDVGAGGRAKGHEVTQEADVVDGQPVTGRQTGKFRPSSALVESLENLTDTEITGSRNSKGQGITKGSSNSFDRSAELLLQPPNSKKRDEHTTGSGWQRMSDNNFSKANSRMMMWDEFRKNSKCRTSESSDRLKNDADHDKKKLVQNLVQMFEKKA